MIVSKTDLRCWEGLDASLGLPGGGCDVLMVSFRCCVSEGTVSSLLELKGRVDGHFLGVESREPLVCNDEVSGISKTN